MLRHKYNFKQFICRHFNLITISWLVYLAALICRLYDLHYSYINDSDSYEVAFTGTSDTEVRYIKMALFDFIGLTIALVLIILLIKFVPLLKKLNQKFQKHCTFDLVAGICTIWLMLILATPTQVLNNDLVVNNQDSINEIECLKTSYTLKTPVKKVKIKVEPFKLQDGGTIHDYFSPQINQSLIDLDSKKDKGLVNAVNSINYLKASYELKSMD